MRRCRTSNTDNISLHLYACHVGAHASLICMRLQENLKGLSVKKVVLWVSFPTLQILMLSGGDHPDLLFESTRISSLLPSDYVGQKQCLTYCNLCKLTVLFVLKYPLLLQMGHLKEHSVVLWLRSHLKNPMYMNWDATDLYKWSCGVRVPASPPAGVKFFI